MEGWRDGGRKGGNDEMQRVTGGRRPRKEEKKQNKEKLQTEIKSQGFHSPLQAKISADKHTLPAPDTDIQLLGNYYSLTL